MKSNEHEQTDVVLLGSYAPRDAAKLLERLEQAGIAFRTKKKTSSATRPTGPGNRIPLWA